MSSEQVEPRSSPGDTIPSPPSELTLSTADLLFILNQVDHGMALFGFNHHLILFNQPLTRLWRLPTAWLETHPHCDQILSALEQQGQLSHSQCLKLQQVLQPLTPETSSTMVTDQVLEGELEILITVKPNMGYLLVFKRHPIKTGTPSPPDEAQRLKEERLRLLESVIVNANDSVVITEAEPISAPGPRIVYANASFTRMTGYSLEEVLGKNPRLLQGPKTDRKTLAKVREALQNWQPILVELINYDRNGTEFWVDLSIVPVADQSGRYTHWVAIQRDITQRKRLEEELLRTLEKEKELNDLKTSFVSMTSHEFRTPLSTILSSSELLEHYGHLWTEAERLEQFHLIQNTVQHMTKLLEDILLIGQAEAARIEFCPEQLDLTRLCCELVAQIQLSIGKQHTITFINQYPIQKAWVDEKLLRQILTNLLSNAIKYSPAGSEVKFELTHEADSAKFKIQDQGIGIPIEDQARLFESFHRGKNVGTIPGTGLGLAIVKQCVTVYGGQISLHSNVGVGTTFEVTLPVDV